uniref:Uncharacterized protein n=1 Tax=Daphnia galeata TaxID=27404 RepID=A0A8J2WM37_9CRUS|nr:unnamed protein product [Daphnia galeata]
MKKETYYQILIRKAVPVGPYLLGEGLIFQEDNDPKHSFNVCRSYFDKKKETGMVFCMPPSKPRFESHRASLGFRAIQIRRIQ